MKGKENIVTDALSKRSYNEIHIKKVSNFGAIIEVLPVWYKEVYKIYEGVPLLYEIIVSKIGNKWHKYIYEDGVLRYKGIIVMGQKGELKEKLVKAIYDSYIDRHARIHNSYKRLEANFY